MNSRIIELASMAVAIILGFVLTLGCTYFRRFRHRSNEEQKLREQQVVDRLERVIG